MVPLGNFRLVGWSRLWNYTTKVLKYTHWKQFIFIVFIRGFVTCPMQPSAMYQKLLSVKPQAPVRHSQRAVIILLRINCTQRVIQRQQWSHGNSWTNHIPRIPPPSLSLARRWRHSSWNPYACAPTRQGSAHAQWLHHHAGYNQPDSRATFRSPESDSDKYVPRGRRRQLAPDEINLESHYGANGRWYF